MDTSERELTLFTDPLLYQEQLNNGAYGEELSPLQIEVEGRKAEREISRREKNAVAVMQQMTFTGQIGTVEELKTEMDSWPEIDKLTRKTLVKEFGNDKPLSAKERIGMRDKISVDFRAWTGGEISTGTYITRYNETQTALAAMGRRQGAGELRGVASRFDPAYKMGENGGAPPEELSDAQEQELKDQAERSKTVEDRAFEAIRTRAGGMMAKEIVETKFPKAEDVDAQVFKNQRKEASLMFRTDMEDLMTEWVASQPTEPNMQEIVSFIDDNQAQVIEGVIVKMLRVEEGKQAKHEKSLKTPVVVPVTPEGVVVGSPTDLLNKQATKELEDLRVQDTLLPPKQ